MPARPRSFPVHGILAGSRSSAPCPHPNGRWLGRSSSSSLVTALAATGIASFASAPAAPAAAQSYDVDCKLILCLADGFRAGCADALGHMMKRLCKGKSLLSFCAMSDGKEYDAYDDLGNAGAFVADLCLFSSQYKNGKTQRDNLGACM